MHATAKDRAWVASLAYMGKVIALYVVFGPIVGLLIFSIGMAMLAQSSAPGGFWIGPLFLLYGWIFAHFMGGPWALMAGAIAAIWARSLRRAASFIGPLSGLATFAIALSVGILDSQIALLFFETNRSSALPDIGILLVLLATFSLSSTACWAIARRFF